MSSLTCSIEAAQLASPSLNGSRPAGKSGIFEAVLSTNLSHPNIVHTYQYAFRPVSVRAYGVGPPAEGALDCVWQSLCCATERCTPSRCR